MGLEINPWYLPADRRKTMKVIDGGVTAAKGFSAYGLRVGIKEGNTEKKDMAMIIVKNHALQQVLLQQIRLKLPL